jgi:hypothetical protein
MFNERGWMVGWKAGVVCALAIAWAAPQTRAQEVISGEVSLGSSLFTVEDLENLSEAAELTKEQQEAARELMRGAMARARTITLRAHRNMQGWEDVDPADMENAMAEWKERGEKQREEVLDLEKSVMNDLKTLLEPKQADEGWPKFERARRRLLLRTVQQVQQRTAMAQQEEGSFNYMSHMYEGDVPDLIGTVRASKLSDADMSAIQMPLEQYASNIDMLVREYRTAAASLLSKQDAMFFGAFHHAELTKDQAGTIEEKIKKMRMAHVRAAKQVGETLKGEGRERFLRQRMRAEQRWQWQPSKRLPQVRAVLKIRSLSESQRSKINELIKQADGKLIESAAQTLHDQDEAILLEKKPDEENPWASMQTPEAMERVKNESRIRRDLVRDIVAELNDTQRNAYETGIENDQDLTNAFETRRHGTDAWGGADRELIGWDMWGDEGEDEEPTKE